MMISDVFYFIGLNIILLNSIFLFNSKKILRVQEWFFKYTKLRNRTPIKSDFEGYSYDLFIFSNFNFPINLFWIFFGLVTSDFLYFLILFFLLVIKDRQLRFFNYDIIGKGVFIIIKSFITLIIGFLVISHFHPNEFGVKFIKEELLPF